MVIWLILLIFILDESIAFLREVGSIFFHSISNYIGTDLPVSKTDICSSQKILGYPTMLIYQDGEKGEEFKGELLLELR